LPEIDTHAGRVNAAKVFKTAILRTLKNRENLEPAAMCAKRRNPQLVSEGYVPKYSKRDLRLSKIRRDGHA